MKGLDGIQGPVYVGTGCVFNRQALYGYGPPSLPGLPTASSPYRSWFGKRSSKEPSKNPSEVYRDAKQEELDAGIFNLKEIESLVMKKIVKQTFHAVIKICLDFSLRIMIRTRGHC